MDGHLEKTKATEALPLSKKLKNKLVDILKRQGRNLTDAHLIFDSINITESNPYILAEINLHTPDVITALISPDYGYFGLDTKDLLEVTKIVIEKIARKESFEDFIISIGMGGSLDIPNVRTPSYIIPAIKTLERLNDLFVAGKIKGIPRVRLIKAENLSSLMNDFDLAHVHRVTELTFAFLRIFLDEFFPHLSSSFIFTTDQKPSESFIQELEDQADLLVANEEIKEEIAVIAKMGSKHGGEQGVKNSLFYAVAHPFYGRSIIKDDLGALAQNESTEVPKVIIDQGGRSQGVFNKISRILIEQNRVRVGYTTPPTLYLLVKTGKIPVYYTARDGDLPLGQNLFDIDLDKLDKSTHRDYKEIFALVGQERFLEFVNKFSKDHEKQIREL